MAKLATATRSSAGFEATKLRAAAIACASGAPRIDCERSIARTTDFSAPRFSVRSIRTASPFSRSFGACELGSDVRTVTRMTGYSPVSDAADRDAGVGGRHGEPNRSCKSDCDETLPAHENPPKLATARFDR